MYNNKTLSYFILVFFISSFYNEITAQQSQYFIVRSTLLKGNKKTRDNIILRELDFTKGDTVFINTLTSRLNENKKRILSTGMFTLVNINVKNWDLTSKWADIEISLVENWYIYPAPIFELADRNFNVWWNDQNKSLDRVNYGARITHINFTGNRDAFRATVHFGYTRKFEVRYSIPFINKEQTLGISGNIFYSDGKEIGYITESNKTLYGKHDDEILLTRFRANGSIEYRPKLNNYHRFNLAYHNNNIDLFVATELNPDYFLDGKTKLQFFVLEYQYRFDKRIFQFYPEGGVLFAINVKKEGLNIFDDYSNLAVSTEFEKYWNPSPKVIIGGRIKAKTNLIRNKVAFANNTGLGYGKDFIRGYELYVIDGTDYLYTKGSIKLKVFEKVLGINKVMPLNAFKKMMAQIYLSANFDAGFVNERDYKDTNTFNNRWLYGYGPGIDIIMYNNFLLKIEYSFNHVGEGGLYLSSQINF